MCAKGAACPFRHVKGDRTIVCKHWLRGLCKKGDDCEFLHEYDMSKMPECYFYSKFGRYYMTGSGKCTLYGPCKFYRMEIPILLKDHVNHKGGE